MGLNVIDYVVELVVVIEKRICVIVLIYIIYLYLIFNEIIWEAVRSVLLKLIVEKLNERKNS